MPAGVEEGACCGEVNSPRWPGGAGCGWSWICGADRSGDAGWVCVVEVWAFPAGRPRGRAVECADRDGGLDRVQRPVCRRAAGKLTERFQPHLRTLLASAPVLHADETTGRVAGSFGLRTGGLHRVSDPDARRARSDADIDAGQVLPAFHGVLVRDGLRRLPASPGGFTPGAALT